MARSASRTLLPLFHDGIRDNMDSHLYLLSALDQVELHIPLIRPIRTLRTHSSSLFETCHRVLARRRSLTSIITNAFCVRWFGWTRPKSCPLAAPLYHSGNHTRFAFSLRIMEKITA
ncbi:hypothetical protein Tcan_00879, partial [Toxocara canis]